MAGNKSTAAIYNADTQAAEAIKRSKNLPKKSSLRIVSQRSLWAVSLE
jgi:hypothetical protein